MKGLILYFTTYGTTKQYAEWIAEEIDAEICNYKEATDAALQDAGFLIIGSFVMAHKLIISRWLAKKENLLRNKKLFFYSVSAAKPDDRELEHIFEVSLPESLLKDAHTYRFGGKLRYDDLSRFHKMMIQIGTMIEKDPQIKADMKEGMKIAQDNINRDHTKPLINDVKTWLAAQR